MSELMETAVLDALEFIGERAELPLDLLGIEIAESDWGDAEQEVFYIRQELGEIPAERHPPNRTITLKLHAREESGVPLAEAAFKLQAKVGILQKEGGWIKRVFSARNRAKVNVGFEIYSASLQGIQGWLMAHRGFANEITLTLVGSSYCYGTEEVEGETFTSVNGRDLEWTFEKCPGTAPGRLRLKIQNKGAFDWLSVLGSIESKDHSPGVTAKMAYKVIELTNLGETLTEVSKAGESGKCFQLSSERLKEGKSIACLGTKIVGSGDMSHVGGRRVLMRIFNECGNTAGNRMQLEWRSLNGEWELNEEVELSTSSNWQLVDLGEVIAQRPVFGEQAWEGRVIIRNAKGETTNISVFLGKLYVLAQEQYFALRKSLTTRIPPSYSLNALTNSALENEALNGKTPNIGGKWETSGSVAGDFLGGILFEGNRIIHRKAVSDTEPRKAVFAAPAATSSVVLAATLQCAPGVSAEGVYQEFAFTFHGENIKVLLKIEQAKITEVYNQRITISIEGAHVSEAKSAQWVLHSIAEKIGEELITNWVITISESTIAVKGFTYGRPSEVNLSATLSSTVGGKIGMTHKNLKSTGQMSVFEFLGYEPEVSYLLHPTRQMNLSSDGVFVQHESLERWGEIPLSDGFLPYAAPSYLEGRPLHGVLIPSQGDLESIADSGENEIAVTPFVRPAYHFMSEAIS